MTKESWTAVSGIQDVPMDGRSKLVVINGDSHPRILWYAGAKKELIIVGGELVHNFVLAPKITHYITIEMP